MTQLFMFAYHLQDAMRARRERTKWRIELIRLRAALLAARSVC